MYVISIPDAAFAVGGKLYGIPPQKAQVIFGILGQSLTFANEQLKSDETSRSVNIRADGTCCLQDEELEGFSTMDRVVLANLMHKGLAQVSQDGGAFLTPYEVAHVAYLG